MIAFIQLSDQQNRVASLEAELAQLRPALLMHSSTLFSSRDIAPRVQERKVRLSGDTPTDLSSKSHYRLGEGGTKLKAARKYPEHFSSPTSGADARTEHLLLAARKIGRKRATLLSRSMYKTGAVKDHLTPTQSELTGEFQLSVPSPSSQIHDPEETNGKTFRVRKASNRTPRSGEYTPRPKHGAPMYTAHPIPFSSPFLAPATSATSPETSKSGQILHAQPPRGYIPAPGWPFYAAAPFAFGHPVSFPSKFPENHTLPEQRTLAGRISPSGGTSRKTSLPADTLRQSKTLEVSDPPKTQSSAMDSLLSAATSVFTPDSGSLVRSSEPDDGRKRKRDDGFDGAEKQPPKTTGLQRQTSALDVLADQAGAVSANASNDNSALRNKPPNRMTASPDSDSANDSRQQSRSRSSITSAAFDTVSGSLAVQSMLLVPPVIRRMNERSDNESTASQSNAHGDVSSTTSPQPVPDLAQSTLSAEDQELHRSKKNSQDEEKVPTATVHIAPTVGLQPSSSPRMHIIDTSATDHPTPISDPTTFDALRRSPSYSDVDAEGEIDELEFEGHANCDPSVSHLPIILFRL